MAAPALERSILPLTVAPMLAQPAEGALDSPDFAYEVKWDGMRVIAGVDGDRLSLVTRNRIEAFPRFPELAALREALGCRSAALDGEIVRMVNGRPDFHALQSRIQLAEPREIRHLSTAEPAALILFDLLCCDGEWLLNEPWETRRSRLEALVRQGETVQLSPVATDGRALWQTVTALGMEGVMAKRRSSRYAPGKRSPDWLKLKRTHTVDAVVGGWTEGSGSRADAFGALIVGCYEDGKLRCVGHVGTGFEAANYPEVIRLLAGIEVPNCPFGEVPEVNSPAHWVRPIAVCEVKHYGWTFDGVLRHPVFVRWRPDKPAAECRLAR